ncbi:MAG: hypothetical protein GXO08_06160 [Aquificae bacterium]|nr:hypothetical protein [Aquificota bacterium]
MKRLLSAALAGALLLASCGGKVEYEPSQLRQEVGTSVKPLEGKEREKLEAVLRAVFPPGWRILDLFAVPSAEKPYLKKYLVKVYSPYEHVVWNRFVWTTAEGDLLFTKTYRVANETVALILPKKEKEYPLESLRWILDVERIAVGGNLPLTLTPGQRPVYLVWNPYCKPCFDRWKELIEEALRKKVSLKLVPYHGVYYPLDNLYALVYLLWKAQSTGNLYSVLNEYYSSAEDFEDFLTRLKEDAFRGLSEVPKEEFNRIGFLLKEVSKVVEGAKVLVVPTSVLVQNVEPKLGLAEGFVVVGRVVLELPED